MRMQKGDVRSHKKGHERVTWGRRHKMTYVRTCKRRYKSKDVRTHGTRCERRRHRRTCKRRLRRYVKRHVWSKGRWKWRVCVEGDIAGYLAGDAVLEGGALCWRRYC